MPQKQDPLAAYKAKDDWFTPSNAISFLRALLTIPSVYLLSAKLYTWAAALFFFAFLTDLADGYIARKTNDVSEIGKIIDPLADKIFVAVTVIAMLVLGLVPFWFVAAVVARDIIILVAGIWATKRFHVVLPSNYPGKFAVLTISLTLFMTVLGFSPTVLMFMQGLSLLLMLVSLGVYGKRLFDLLRQTARA